jgi:hypothetical protein
MTDEMMTLRGLDLLRKSGELFFLEEGFHGRPEADLYP